MRRAASSNNSAASSNLDLVAERIHFGPTGPSEQVGEWRPFDISVSIGIVSYDPENDSSVEEMMAFADREMYANKRGEPTLN